MCVVLLFFGNGVKVDESKLLQGIQAQHSRNREGFNADFSGTPCSFEKFQKSAREFWDLFGSSLLYDERSCHTGFVI